MRATLISTDGPWLEAKIDADGRVLVVMDQFSNDEGDTAEQGSKLEIELSAMTDDDSSWEEMFSGNPDRLRAIEQIDAWSYRAYGQVTSVDPVCVDCGLLEVQDVFDSHDPRVIGEFIRFTISRLTATAAAPHSL